MDQDRGRRWKNDPHTYTISTFDAMERKHLTIFLIINIYFENDKLKQSENIWRYKYTFYKISYKMGQ